MVAYPPVVKRFQMIGIAGLLSLTAGSALASGFALIEQSVSSMGSAYAGAGTASNDATTAYFNPATLSGLAGTQASVGAHLVIPQSDFTGSAAYNTNTGPFAGIPISGGDGGNGGEISVVPHAAYAMDINERWTFGLSVNIPFGLSTQYDSDWVGRYSAIDSEILTVNINPMLSYRLNDKVSVGAGLSAMHARLKLFNALDTSVLASQPPGTFPDSHGEVDVKDWAYGYNLGLLLEPNDKTRFGIAYRSGVDVDLDGQLGSTFSGQPNTTARVSETLPASALFSVSRQVDDMWTVMADVLWTQWSEIDNVVAQFGTGNTNTLAFHWNDATRVSVGANYRHDDRWTFRGGLAYDESPVPGAMFRPAALPDEDRFWLALGAGYRYSRQLSFDIGYAHLFIDDTRINSTDAYSSLGPNNEGLHRITGEFDASVDILSAQANLTF